MKKAVLIFCSLTVFNPLSAGAQDSTVKIDQGLTGVQQWLDAWELVATDILNLTSEEPPLLLLYDEQYLYTTAAHPPKNSIKIQGPRFFDRDLPWTKMEHGDSLQLPSGEKLPVDLYSFAGPLDPGSGKAFFLMAVPSFWKKAQVTSKELGDENLYTGVFLHEFAHAQQMGIFGARLDAFEKTYDFEFGLSDDLIQQDLERDSTYTKIIKEEMAVFYRAFYARDEEETHRLLKKGLQLYHQRQERYFEDQRAVYKTLDDFFLTMEGIGQYVAVAWLAHPEGAGLEMERAVEGMRRGGKWWSQEESLALFLIYTKLSNPDLGKEMFGNRLHTILELLERLPGDRN